jgi:hypothetical protein
MIPKIGPGNEVTVKNSVLLKPYTTPTIRSPQQSRDDQRSALPRQGERSDRQDGNTDARPWREPGRQCPAHRDDDNEDDECCSRKSNCEDDFWSSS